MSGYDGYSMSTRARRAYAEGLLPASKIKGVPAELIRRFVRAEEWHHTSSRYNETKFYDPAEVLAVFGLAEIEDFDVDPEAVAALAEWRSRKKEAPTVRESCTVTWLEWGGTRRHPTATEQTEHGCRVEVKGQTATITLPDGRLMKKRLSTRGFAIREENENNDRSICR